MPQQMSHLIAMIMLVAMVLSACGAPATPPRLLRLNDCRASTADCSPAQPTTVPQTAGGKKLIAIITASLDNPFFVTMADTARSTPKNWGMTPLWRRTTTMRTRRAT